MIDTYKQILISEQELTQDELNSLGVTSINEDLYEIDTALHVARVEADGGTIADLTQLKADTQAVQDLEPTLLISAGGGFKAGKLYSVKPNDGSGDFAVVRAGTTAYTQNPDGTWRPAVADEPRYTYENGVPAILIEGAAMNLVSRFRTFPHSNWTKTNGRIEGDPNPSTPELGTNYGAVGQTDWVDSNSDGIADGVLVGAGADLTIGSIVTGNGFTGNAQRLQENNASNKLFVRLASSIAAGSLVSVALKYRSNVVIQSSGTSEFILLKSIPVNEGNAQSITTFFYVNNNTTVISFYSNALENCFFEIDEVSIKVTTGFDSPFVDANGVNQKDAYKFVATGANANLKLTTAATVVSTTVYTNFLFIKRITGTGNVFIEDINDTDRAITVTPEWTQVSYSVAASSTSGQIGIKLATSGDEVMICHAQMVASTVVSSPIGGAEGSQQTRNADVDTLTYALPTSGTIRFRGYFPENYPLQINACVAEVSGWKDIRYVYSGTNQKLYVDEVLIDEVNIAADFTEMTGLTFQAENGNEFPFTNFSIQ